MVVLVVSAMLLSALPSAEIEKLIGQISAASADCSYEQFSSLLYASSARSRVFTANFLRVLKAKAELARQGRARFGETSIELRRMCEMDVYLSSIRDVVVSGRYCTLHGDSHGEFIRVDGRWVLYMDKAFPVGYMDVFDKVSDDFEEGVRDVIAAVSSGRISNALELDRALIRLESRLMKSVETR